MLCLFIYFFISPGTLASVSVVLVLFFCAISSVKCNVMRMDVYYTASVFEVLRQFLKPFTT